jgi:hypothetical protein
MDDDRLERCLELAIKALGICRQETSEVIRAVEMARERSRRMRRLEAILAELREENQLVDEVQRLLVERDG